jgi:hypothetical protein
MLPRSSKPQRLVLQGSGLWALVLDAEVTLQDLKSLCHSSRKEWLPPIGLKAEQERIVSWRRAN